jgi:protein-S-isoprenylcysteine O-methyltransferase Ste14
MMTEIQILKYLWVALGLYWLLRARHSGRTVTDEATWWRGIRLMLLSLSFTLLFSSAVRVGPLAWRFLPPWEPLSWLGVVVTMCGVALSISARLHLGANWSDKVVLKADHQLIRTGPYKHLRHPIYSGVLLGILGTALAIGEWRGLLALVIMIINYHIKARREERILTAQFGDAYRDYMQTAGFPLPKF